MKQVNLVVQTAFLGDLILSIPMLRRVKKNQPDCDLVVICKKGIGEFLVKENIVDQLIEVEKGKVDSYETALALIKKNFSVKNLYCVHKSIRSLLFTAKIKAERKIGFSSLLGFWIFDDMVEYEKKLPEVLRQFKILESTDDETKNEFLKDDLFLLNEVGRKIPDFFKFNAALFTPPEIKKIGLFPGSVWATKRWTREGFIELIRLFQSHGFEVDLLGGLDEIDLCRQIAEPFDNIKVRAGTLTIAESIEDISNYSLVITNDSAPAHMAAYRGTPVLTLFGPTKSSMGFRPWSDKSLVIENEFLSCRPCGAHGPMICPLKHHDCMKSIKAQTVFKRALDLLKTLT